MNVAPGRSVWESGRPWDADGPGAVSSVGREEDPTTSQRKFDAYGRPVHGTTRPCASPADGTEVDDGRGEG